MEVAASVPLFAWRELEDSPSLGTLAQLLRLLPDEALLGALRRHRGAGRNEYKVETLWGVVVLSVALRHTSLAACLAELRRNPSLRLLIGCESEAQVPRDWNMSRFLRTLGLPEHVALVHAAFDRLATTLGVAIPDFGRTTAGDATALRARSDRAAPVAGLPPPSGGRKEYVDEAGKVVDAYEWFGYKLHLLVDTRYEVAFAYTVTDTKAGDGETLPVLLEAADANLPPGRIDTLAYDRAADTVDVHAALGQRGIRPLIQVRHLWKGEPLRELPGHPRHPVPISYDELGTVYCTDTSGEVPVHRPMTYCGREQDRGTLKYRCPALMRGFDCPGEKLCNKGKTYGLTIRLKEELDLRRFPPIPRATKTFERLYKGRTAVERVNARCKLYWGLDDGNLTGAGRFHALVGAVMLVHLAFATLLATAPRRPDRFSYVGLGPVQEALARAAKTPPA